MNILSSIKRSVTEDRTLTFFIYFFVFFTGASGLIYQVTWQKYLSRLVGSDTMATAIIIGTFLGGLSLGYFFCGKLSARVTNQLRAYAVLEGVIGLWCLVFPPLFEAYYASTTFLSFEPPFWIIFQGVFSSLVLFGVPTICMGATVPLLTRGISSSVSVATSIHAKVYGINTAGGFVGTLAAGFWILPLLGLPLTMMTTSLINLVTAFFFYAISRKGAVSDVTSQVPARRAAESEPPPAGEPKLPRTILYLIAFFSGLYVMTLENVLIRVANLSFGSSSYSFSLIIAVFLLAIAIGSYVVGRFRQLPRHALFTNQLLLTLLMLALYCSLDAWPYLAHLLRISFQGNQMGFILYYILTFIALTAILILPLSLCGATLPIAFHEAKRDLARVGQDSGSLLSFNTFGNLLGSIFGGVVVFYFLDMEEVFTGAVLLAGASTLLASIHLGRRAQVAGGITLVIALVFAATTPFFTARHFSMGSFRYREATPLSFAGPKRFFAGFQNTYDTLFLSDGPACTVAVVETNTKVPTHPKSRAIVVNGKSDSDTVADIYTTKLSAHFPSLLANDRGNALVVGVGTGVTVAELARYDYDHIVVAEISPNVIEALPFFDEATGSIGEDPRVEIRTGDAFRVLARSEERWDVVVSEPSNPWVMGVDMLYTQEFYTLVKERLNDDGAFLQWIHIYAANPQMVGMVANTLASQFEEVHVFLGGTSDLLFVATERPLSVENLQAMDEVLESNPRARASLQELGVIDADALLVRQLWTKQSMQQVFQGYGQQTLDNPRLHYIAGKAFFVGDSLATPYIFPSNSADHEPGFLLSRKRPDWQHFVWSASQLEQLLRATRTNLREGVMGNYDALRLQAFLQNPTGGDISPDSLRSADHRLIAMAMGTTSASSDRDTVRRIIEEVERSRSWIAPYPVDGLKTLLRAGLRRADSPHDRNFFAMHLLKLALLENASPAVLSSLSGGIERDSGGAPILHPEDYDAWRKIDLKLRTYTIHK